MSLREAAQQAATDRSRTEREAARKRREEELGKVIEKLGEGPEVIGSLAHRLGPEFQRTFSPEDFSYCKVRQDGARSGELYGFRFEFDDVSFLYSTSYGNEGLHVILTCPDCGGERAEHVWSLEELGRKLKTGRASSHHCLVSEAREVAYAIGSSARDAKVSPDEIVQVAYEKHSDLIYRLLGR